MSRYATTKMSSKGQVVIPEEIRKSLRLKEGDQFVVLGRGATGFLNSITPPSIDQFGNLLSEIRVQAKKAGIKKSDLKASIAKVRRNKNK